MNATGFATFEGRIATNPGHCAVLLHQALLGWTGKQSDILPIRAAMAILPIACHGRTVRALYKKRARSAVHEAIRSDPAWEKGFHNRLVRYSPVTMNAIAFGHAQRIFALEHRGGYGLLPLESGVFVVYEPLSEQTSLPSLQPSAAAQVAKQLGKWMAEFGPDQCLDLLGWRVKS